MDQYTILLYLGWIGVMLLVGMVLRAKVKFLRNMLMPSCVIGGVVGFTLINTGVLDLDVSLFSKIASQLFTISFIAIGLTAPDKSSSSDAGAQAKSIVKGSLGIGVVWVMIFILQYIMGSAILKGCSLFGFGIDPHHGMMLPRAFAQGPGQSVNYGGIFEGLGLENAVMVGLAFAAMGFLFAFLFGVPLARWGLKKKLTKYNEEISDEVLKGFFNRDTVLPSAGKQTTHSGNIDSLAFHIAMICVTYLVTYHVTFWFASYLTPTWAKVCTGMIFLWGMIVGYLVRWILKKLNIDHMMDNTTQKRLTGWATDFLIASAFMAVSVKALGSLMVPVVITGVIGALLTFGLCLFFGQRFGGDYDFERTLGLYGMATGTAASGVALCRIVDPELRTTTAVEIGGANVFMNLNLLMVPLNIAPLEGVMSLPMACLCLGACIIPLFIFLKVGGAFRKKTYTLKGKL